MSKLQSRTSSIRRLECVLDGLVAEVALAQEFLREKQAKLDKVKTKLESLKDDLLGDLVNGCFPECPWA